MWEFGLLGEARDTEAASRFCHLFKVGARDEICKIPSNITLMSIGSSHWRGPTVLIGS